MTLPVEPLGMHPVRLPGQMPSGLGQKHGARLVSGSVDVFQSSRLRFGDSNPIQPERLLQQFYVKAPHSACPVLVRLNVAHEENFNSTDTKWKMTGLLYGLRQGALVFQEAPKAGTIPVVTELTKWENLLPVKFPFCIGNLESHLLHAASELSKRMGMQGKLLLSQTLWEKLPGNASETLENWGFDVKRTTQAAQGEAVAMIQSKPERAKLIGSVPRVDRQASPLLRSPEPGERLKFTVIDTDQVFPFGDPNPKPPSGADASESCLPDTFDIKCTHQGLVMGVIRRRMRDLAPEVPYDIELANVSSDIWNRSLRKTISPLKNRMKAAPPDGINLSLGDFAGYYQLPRLVNTDYAINSLNVAYYQRKLRRKLGNKEARMQGFIIPKSSFGILHELARLYPVYVGAGNFGEEAFSFYAWTNRIHVVGGHDPDGFPDACNSTKSFGLNYAPYSWVARPVFDKDNELAGLSFGEDGEIDIPRSELRSNTSVIDAQGYPTDRLCWPIKPEDLPRSLYLTGGTSLSSPCRMVEDALARRGFVQFVPKLPQP